MLLLKAFRADGNKIVGGGGGKANETVVNLSKKNKSRNLMRVPNIEATGEPNILTLNAKKAFNYLRLVFIKAPILQHFDLESHIWIKPDTSSYAIDGVLS